MKRVLLMLVTIAMVLMVMTACTKKSNHNAMGHGAQETSTGHGAHETFTGHGAHGGADGSEHKDTTTASWTFSTSKLTAGEITEVTIQIQDKEGKAVKSFDINHEKKMHLIVVSKDLSYFDHIHPEYKEEGTFVVQTKLPSAGSYKLIADYIPTGSGATSQSHWVTVEGKYSVQEGINPESSLVKKVGDIEVTLSFDQLMANMDVNLNFNMIDVHTGKPIKDLQPYLGAVGHVVILSSDAEQYLHVHPTDESAKGPDAQFRTSFPTSGVYKIWGQFQRNDKPFIVSFVVKVP
ncbi:hypothetical protein [Cohnella abietis]|uniref:YtkA-like domain-containing protein n=1 Tax=Cohnella abietis TaxID=2507935 RepID=A0A3T1D800_9BACL|nr:hypothetical protein [Cohnella abietis]BBI34198.1 hypothetical protein KCTCHS21_35970 [Cohnella abietis]